ncbi:hypothetical protein DFP91_2424 [Pseudorhodoplanes sinuspersici]|nr:hypothetical protein DFP91_2424 [Pseudorhodoplanes sinuspersici]
MVDRHSHSTFRIRLLSGRFLCLIFLFADRDDPQRSIRKRALQLQGLRNRRRHPNLDLFWLGEDHRGMALGCMARTSLFGSVVSDLTGFSWTRLIEIIGMERTPDDAKKAT